MIWSSILAMRLGTLSLFGRTGSTLRGMAESGARPMQMAQPRRLPSHLFRLQPTSETHAAPSPFTNRALTRLWFTLPVANLIIPAEQHALPRAKRERFESRLMAE